MNDIKVFLIDNSAVVRQVLTPLLDSISDVTVIGSAPDPELALKKMHANWPDVILLDIEMPCMNGISFLKKIMLERPTPIIICSSLTTKGADISLQVINAGAADFITKPKVNLKGFLQGAKILMTNTIKKAAYSPVPKVVISKVVTPKQTKPPVVPIKSSVVASSTIAPASHKIIAIGASTGGTPALEYILTRLAKNSPGIIVVQHMPENFTAAFAKRLNSICQVTVKEAKTNDKVIAGQVLIAPGDKHMTLCKRESQYYVEIKSGPLVNRHRPSVDVLFQSASQAAGKNAIGIIMTGMGNDGAKGLKELHTTGALTIAQDEASCVVCSMPHEATKLGGVDAQLTLEKIPNCIMQAPDRMQFLR